MTSQNTWIGITIGIFFVGLIVGYVAFVGPMNMNNQDMMIQDPQFRQQMMEDPQTMSLLMNSMMQNPQMQQQMVETMMQNPQMQQQMVETMMQNPQQMQQMIMTTMQDSDQMQMMEDMMKDMMERMQNDPELNQAMMEHMDRMKASRDAMMGTDNIMMNGMMNSNMEKVISNSYNKDLNPNQIEYPNILGFNDLHIEAIRHLTPNGDDSKLEVNVHHHCKVYDDMTAACLLFPTGMGDQDRPYGIEYIISSQQFEELSDNEKQYWHYHLTELPKAQANFPDLTDEELAPLQPVLDETYGKVFYFWNIDDKYPIGEPTVLVVQDLPE